MKVSPVIQSTPIINPEEGKSAGADRIARAMAVMQGKNPDEATPNADPQVEKTQAAIRRIKMKTQMSTNRHEMEDPAVTTEAPAAAEPVATELVDTPVDNVDTIEPVVAPEASKPLSPQFAAIAKQKRMLQLKEQALLAREKAIEGTSTNAKALEEYKARIKANALSVLQEEGVTYDQLTEQILANNQGNQDVEAIKAELKAIKNDFENQKKSLTEKEAAGRQQTLKQIRRDTDQLVAQGEEFEMIREAGYSSKVVELIEKTFDTTGEILDTREAAQLIEKELLQESLKFARIKKVQSQLRPAQTPQQPQPTGGQQAKPNTKIMRTLTNRDGVSSSGTMSKRERAIAAMEGRLVK